MVLSISSLSTSKPSVNPIGSTLKHFLNPSVSPSLHHYWPNASPLHLSLVNLGLIFLPLLLLLSILHTLVRAVFCKHKSYHVYPCLKCFGSFPLHSESGTTLLFHCSPSFQSLGDLAVPTFLTHFIPPSPSPTKFQLLELSVPLSGQVCSCLKAFALAASSVWTMSCLLHPRICTTGSSSHSQLKCQFFKEDFLSYSN